MKHSLAVPVIVGLASWIALSPTPLHAQDPAGREAESTLSFGLLYKDDAWKAYSGFDFTLSSSTRTEGLGLSASGGLEGSGADGLNLVDPNILLTYNRTGRNAALAASARYRESDLGGFTIDEDTSAGELIANTGTKKDANIAGSLEFGTVSPLGGKIDMGWREVKYSGATTLADYDAVDVGVTLRFTIDPRIDLRTTARYQETLADAPGTDRVTQSIGFGADFKVNQTLNTSIDLTYAEIETRPTGGPVQKDSGPGFEFTAQKDLKNGDLGFYLTSTLTTVGNRTEAQVARTFETAQGDGLMLSAGVSRSGNDEVDAIFGLEYSRSTRDAELNVALSRYVQSDLFGQETLNSQFRIGHSYAINDTSRIESALAYRETQFLTSTALDARKLEISLGYSKKLTSVFDLSAEVSQIRDWTGSAGPTTDNTVFLGLTRAFSWAP